VTLFSTDLAVRTPGRDEAVEFLMRDRPWSAYGLGYLERTSGVPTSLVASASPTAITSVVVQAQLPQLLSIVAIGDPEGIGASIESLPSPPSSGVFSIRGEALSAFERRFNVSSAYQMRRLRLGPGRLEPRPGPRAVRLGLDDLEPVKRLYGMWTDAHQLPGQLSRGIYYGIYAGDQLVSVAGTHVVSAEFGVGAIGNVLTHVDYRGRGLASATTTAVAMALAEAGCEEVVLNVRQGNDVAYRVYRALGFEDHCTFIEGVFHAFPGRR
jgi:ribosomal protein S18 acetylase RimI-like enzyme